MQREVIKWLQTLDLSHPVKNPHRDLANGFTVAEIISRYAEVLPMHAVTTGVSKDSRRQNWRQILAALQRLHCSTVTEQLVDAILRLQPNAAMVVLERLYEFFTHRALPAHSLVAADCTSAMLTRVVAPHETMSDEPPDDALTATSAGLTCAEGVLSAMAQTLPHGHTTVTSRSNELPPLLSTVTAAQEALALTRNDELARAGVRQLAGVRPLPPGYTQPTTATLLHDANHTRQQIVLAKDKYEDDELSARACNEAIEQQHMQMQRARRTAHETSYATTTTTTVTATATATPPRSLTERLRGRSVGLQKERPASPATTQAPLLHSGGNSRARLQSNATNAQRTRRSTAARSQGGGQDGDSDARTIAGAASVLNGNTGANAATGGLVPKLKVNVMRAELMEALRNNGVTAEFGVRAGQKSVEFFASCGHSLRKAFSSLLKDVLAAHHELYNVLEWCGEHSEGSVLQDLFTAVVAYRDALQPTTLRACWVALEQNVDGIAAAIGARQDEYAYLLHALGYVFTAESAHVALLHVSDITSAASRPADGEDRSDAEDKAQGGSEMSGAGRTAAAATTSAAQPQPNTRAQAVWYDRRASHLASAFVFLGKVGEAVRRRGPETALRALRLGFLPIAQSTLLLHGSPAIVEAVGRVIVSHLCSFAPPPPPSPPSNNAAEGEKSQAKWLQQHAQQAEALVALLEQLAGSLQQQQQQQQQVTMGDGGQAVRRLPREAAASRFYLLLYHVLRYVTNKLQGSLATRNAAAHEALLHRVWHGAFAPLVLLTRSSVAPALASEQVSTRCVGVGLLTLLVMWRQEELVCSLLTALQPAAGHKSTLSLTRWVTDMIHGGGTVAATWELRVWLLEMLTLLFRHTVQRMVAAQRRSAAATSADEDDAASDRVTCQALREMERAALVCLESFLRSAPPSQRQLALSIVGGRLLPEYQPRLAARWLRAVLHCHPAALRSRLLPWGAQEALGVGYEQAGYNNDNSGGGSGGGAAWQPTRLRRATLAALDLAAEESNMNAAMLDKLPNAGSMSQMMLQGSAGAHTAAQLSGTRPVSAGTTVPGETPPEKALTLHGGSEGEGNGSDGSMSVLLGKVEPAYVVSPLNQSWNTCGVVHLVLQHLHWMSAEQVLTILAAALLSPQQLSVQAAQLLHDVYLTLSRHTARAPASADTELDASCATNAATAGEGGGGGGDVELAVTLHSLVLPHVPHDAEDEAAKGKTRGGEARDTEALWHDLDACRAEGASRLPQAFWRSVLRRLLPLIRACLTASSSSSRSGGSEDASGGDEDNGTSRPSSSATHDERPSEEARELAWLVLSRLYRMYIPYEGNDESTTAMMDVDEVLDSATRWVSVLPGSARG